VAPAIKIPKSGKTGTPPGMEGVRPKPPKALKPPGRPTPLKRPGGARVPFVVTLDPSKGSTFTPSAKLPDAPAAPPAPPAAASTPPPPAAPTTPFNYADAFLADPRFATGMAGITQTQLGVGSNYGFTLNRDTTEGSPTKGMVLYRVPGTEPGKGNITGRVDPVTGAFTYVDPSGEVYDVTKLELDVIPIKRGERGYLQGALGQAAAGSEKQQFAIGDAAARAGARRSGMRASSSSAETQALQDALRNLSVRSGGEFAGTTGRYADLINTIFPDLVKRAGEYATPPAEAPAAPEAPAAAAPAAPEYAGYNAPVPGNPTSGTLSAGPGGQFMTMIGNVTLERNTNDKAIREGLRAFLNNPAYQLSAQQIRYINSLITGRYKGNKKY
jgi:hypothetical protein